MQLANWINQTEPTETNNTEYQKRKKEFEQLKKENNVAERIDYWWANAESFAKLAETTPFPKDCMYTRACINVHFNVPGILQYIDNSEDDILIGETDKGIRLPLLYSSLNLYEINSLIYGSYPQLISENSFLILKKVMDTISHII